MTLETLLTELNDGYVNFNLTRIDESGNKEKVLENANQEEISKYVIENTLVETEIKMVFNDKTTVNIFI
jgi:hypothetical protein